MKISYTLFRHACRIRRIVNKSYNSGKIIPELKEYLNHTLNEERKFIGDERVQLAIDNICTNLLNEPYMKQRCVNALREIFLSQIVRYYQCILDDVAKNDQKKKLYQCPDHFNIEDCYYANRKSIGPLVDPYGIWMEKALIESAHLSESSLLIEFIYVKYKKKDVNDSTYYKTGEKFKGTYDPINGVRTLGARVLIPSLSI